MDTSGTPPTYECLLRGSNMTPKEGRNLLDRLAMPGFDRLTLERDRYNPYDNYAVKVILHDEEAEGTEYDVPHFIGYLHRDTAMWVGQWIDAGWKFAVEIIALEEPVKKREHTLRLTPLEKGKAWEPSPPTNHVDITGHDDDDIPF